MKFTENDDFRNAYREGKSCGNDKLVLFACPNKLEVNRFGVSVSKKVGNSVVRHRVKRLFKEAYRLREEEFRSGLDIVVLARPGAAGKSFSQLYEALMKAVRRLRIAGREKDFSERD